jgi:hypothetical protein
MICHGVCDSPFRNRRDEAEIASLTCSRSGSVAAEAGAAVAAAGVDGDSVPGDPEATGGFVDAGVADVASLGSA